MGEKCTLKASKKFELNDAISKEEEWKMQCKRMHGDRGRVLSQYGGEVQFDDPMD